MRTCDLLKLFLKAAGVGATTGLVTTTSVVGADVLGMTIANAFSSIPTDGDQCLDAFSHQRRLDSKIILWSFLASAPGLLFGALYFLSKQINVCNPSASQYETIDDDDQNASVVEFFKDLMTDENQVLHAGKKLLIALAIGLSFLAVTIGPAKFFIDDIDRDVWTADDCHSDMRGAVIFELIMSVMMFGMMFGAILCMSKLKKEETNITPAQQETGAALPQPSSEIQTPYVPDHDDGTIHKL